MMVQSVEAPSDLRPLKNGQYRTLMAILGGALALLILITIPLTFPLLNYSLLLLKASLESPASAASAAFRPQIFSAGNLSVLSALPSCDLAAGDWIPANSNPDAAPPYTNDTCWAIHEHLNCLKYGRPDAGFLRWRWRPDACDLHPFNPAQFLELMRHRALAFVGDNIARNHLQSLICLLSKDPDLVVESTSSSSSSFHTVRQSASSPPKNDQTQPQSSGSTAYPNSKSPLWDRHMVLFSVNAWVLLVTLFAMIPMVPRDISHRAYRLSFMGTACSTLFSLFIKCGTPSSLDMEALAIYFQAVFSTKAFVYLIYSVTFVASNLCLKFALIPIILVAVEQIAKFVRRTFPRSVLYRKRLERPCAWVESNVTTLSLLSSNVEIALGFLLIISLFTWQRNIVQTFMYWQLLKLMYHFPMTAGYHQSAWAKVGRKVNPFVSRFLPFLKPLLSAAKRWWSR